MNKELMSRLTKQQYEKLDRTINTKEFNNLLEEYTGITAKPRIFYDYFDSMGKYVGNSQYNCLDGILNKANIIVNFE